MRQKVTGYNVEATTQRREEPPLRVFTKIHLNDIVMGENINPEAVEKAIALSEEKYCLVGDIVKKAAEITCGLWDRNVTVHS
jgi:putative redox protein